MKFLDQARPLQKLLTRAHLLPVAGYIGLLSAYAIIVWLTLGGLIGDYQEEAAARDTLDRLEGGKLASETAGLASSPFLEGRTLTIAGAALQQRVVEAVREAHGNVLSAQVDLQKSEAKQGLVSLTAVCEIEQSNLQQLLYELETGMPFLYIDQLMIQLPQLAARNENALDSARHLHVQIEVSGQWQVSK